MAFHFNMNLQYSSDSDKPSRGIRWFQRPTGIVALGIAASLMGTILWSLMS